MIAKKLKTNEKSFSLIDGAKYDKLGICKYIYKRLMKLTLAVQQSLKRIVKIIEYKNNQAISKIISPHNKPHRHKEVVITFAAVILLLQQLLILQLFF